MTDPLLAIGGDELPVAHMEASGLEPSGPVGTFREVEGASAGFTLQLRPSDPPVRFITRADPCAYRAMTEAILRVAETMDVERAARARARRAAPDLGRRERRRAGGMSRRPRAPLSLRLLAREQSIRAALEIDAGETTRLADPLPETGGRDARAGARELGCTRSSPTSRRRRQLRACAAASTWCRPRS